MFFKKSVANSNSQKTAALPTNDARAVFSLYGFIDAAPIPESYQINIDAWNARKPNRRMRIMSQPPEPSAQCGAAYRGLCEEIFHALDQKPAAAYRGILRCDASRYMYAYRYGISYTDLDVHPAASLHDVWKKFPDKNLVFGVETALTLDMIDAFPASINARHNHGYAFRIANYLFFCRKKQHPFWVDVLDELARRARQTSVYDVDAVLQVTGPGLLTDVFWTTRWKYDDIGLMDSETFNALFVHQTSNAWKK